MTPATYFTLTGRPYTVASGDGWADVAAWHRHVQNGCPDTSRTAHLWSMAIDVFGPAGHVWRSWDDALGETCDDWARRTHPDVTLSDHDGGPWGVPGIEGIAAWPVPTEDAVRASCPPCVLSKLRQWLVSIAAVVSGAEPGPEAVDTGTIPSAYALSVHMQRGKRYRVFKVGEYSIRIHVVPSGVSHAAKPTVPTVVWWARLSEREVKRNTLQDTATFETRVEMFRAPENATASHLIREARHVLDLTGWPMARKPPGLVWHLTRARYQIEIRRGLE